MKMSRIIVASAIDLIRRKRIAAKSSPVFGNLVRLFSYLCSKLHNCSREDKPKLRGLYLSCVHELNDVLNLFH